MGRGPFGRGTPRWRYMGREPSPRAASCRVVAVTVLGTAGNPLPSDVWAPVTGALVVVECSVHVENSHGSQSA
jgi:hypothetical protein